MRLFVLTVLLVVLSIATPSFAETAARQTMAVAITTADTLPAKAMVLSKLDSEKYVFRNMRLENVAELLEAEPAEVTKVLGTSNVSGIIVATLDTSYDQSYLSEDLLVCHILFNYKIYDEKGEELDGGVINASGPGFAKANALETATNQLAEMLRTKAKALALRKVK